MNKTAFAASILVIFAFISYGDAATSKCYACLDKSCGDPFNKTLVGVVEEKCSLSNLPIPSVNLGRASKVDLDFECVKFSTGDSVMRACSPIIDGLDICDVLTFFAEKGDAKDIDCDTCTGDLCNNSPIFHTSIFLTISALFAKILL